MGTVLNIVDATGLWLIWNKRKYESFLLLLSRGHLFLIEGDDVAALAGTERYTACSKDQTVNEERRVVALAWIQGFISNGKFVCW